MQHATNADASAAEKDLRWYFTRSDMGPLKSNYGAMIYRIAMSGSGRGSHAGAEDDEMLESAARAGGVARILRSLDPHTAELLWRTYGAEWPPELELLGEISALAPMTDAAKEAHQASGDEGQLDKWLALFLRDAIEPEELAVVRRIHDEARQLRVVAITSCRKPGRVSSRVRAPPPIVASRS